MYTYLSETSKQPAIQAPLDIITLEDITYLEREHLTRLEEATRKKRSGGILTAIGNGIKAKLNLLGQASSAGVAHFSGALSSSHHSNHHDEPEVNSHAIPSVLYMTCFAGV